MEACFKATQEAYADECAKNASFKKIYDDWRVFRNNEAAWFNVAEQAFAQFSYARIVSTAIAAAHGNGGAPFSWPAGTGARHGRGASGRNRRGPLESADQPDPPCKSAFSTHSLAYLLWGLLPLYIKTLQGIAPGNPAAPDGVVIGLPRPVLSWRATGLAGRGAGRPRVLAVFAISALLLCGNWFTYIWSVDAGRVVDASLGYFINPLVSVLLGVLFLHERLRPGQWASIGLAAAGGLADDQRRPVALDRIGAGGHLRRLRPAAQDTPLGAPEGLSLETPLLFPLAGLALWYLFQHGQAGFAGAGTGMQALLVLAGPITAVPLLLFAPARGASRCRCWACCSTPARRCSCCWASGCGMNCSRPRSRSASA